MKKITLFLFVVSLFNLNLLSQANWDGDGAQGNFSWNNNWYSDTQPGTGSGTDLIFNYKNGSQTQLYYDWNWTNFRSIIYAATFPSSLNFNGNGNGINFYWKVENNSSHKQTINIPLSFKGTGSELNPVSGDLEFTNVIYNDVNKSFMTYFGSSTKSLILSSYIVGNNTVTLTLKNSNYGIVKINSNMPNLSSSSFSGGVKIERGELWFNEGSAINGGTIYVGNGDANYAKLYINDSNGGTSVSNALNIPANSSNSIIGGLNSSGTNTFSGNVTLNSTVTLETVSTGTLNFTGKISGANNVTVSGNGTVQLSGSNTYTGTTTVNSGILELKDDQSSSEIIVKSGAKLTINGLDIDINDLTIEDDGIVEVLSNKQLTINGTLTNNGTFTVKNGATIKTTTVSGNGTNNVELELSGSVDNTARQWWYVSSPVSAAKSSVFDAAGTNNLGWFNEEGNPPAYVQITDNTTDLIVGKGYLFQNKATATYTFTGGSLNNDNQPISLTRTGNTEGQRGFNLVGNPYPSYLDWKTAYDAISTSNIRSTIWYRTTTGTANGMKFITYNASTNIGTEGATRIVPPMQGFWMKVNQDGSGGSITFTNDMRSHATETANPLKAPAAGTNAMQLLRLKLSNGSVTDEAIMVGISGASDLVETFDSEKMANNSIEIPELYSFVGTQELAINSVVSLSAGRQFVLGFRPGKSGAFTIEANQFENITDDVYLVDQHTSTETKLSAGTVYNFTSDATATNDRFNVEFRAPGITTAVTEPNAANTFVFVNEAGQIGVQSAAGKDALISVYNTAGQQLAAQPATGSVTLIQQSFSSGVYLVKVNNLLQKVVIN